MDRDAQKELEEEAAIINWSEEVRVKINMYFFRQIENYSYYIDCLYILYIHTYLFFGRSDLAPDYTPCGIDQPEIAY